MTDRAPFIRPSSLEAIEACPGRPLMEARACALVPSLRDYCSEVAKQGTLGHAVIAGVLTDALAGDWSQAPVVVADLERRMGGLERWTRDAVRSCVAYAIDLLRRLHGWYQIQILTEEHLDGAGIDIARGGSADLVVVCMDDAGRVQLVVVVDWKTGFCSQGEAADHLQLAGYAVMAADRWAPLQGVVVHLAMGRRKEFSESLYDRQAIAGARARIRRAVAAAQAEAPELRPCLTACRYCRALTTCRAAREFLMNAAQEFALFGADPADRLALADAAALAKRFAADADALAKQWRADAASAAHPSPAAVA